MHKLIVMFEPPRDHLQFEQDWMKFLRIVEGLPGLRRETVARVQDMPHGREDGMFVQVHELYFDTRDDLEQAMRSKPGQAAGKYLLEFTHGRVTVLVAEHLEATPDQFTKSARGSSEPAQDVPD